MNPNTERIEADLRGLLEGDVRCDDVFVQMYANDASIYEVKPLGVVRPRHTADVVACVQYAQENEIPIHARGAGTGLAGESLGPGLILDFSHSMRRILHTDDEHVSVQPGVTLAQLNRHLALRGRLFGPDPATSQVTTMGSVLAIDASGSHWMQYGSARSNVVSMQVVLDDGSICKIEKATNGSTQQPESNQRLKRITSGISRIIERDAELIAERTPRSLVNRCGYCLNDVLKNGHTDVVQLLVGSEGTLALTVEATVRTHPIPRHQAIALLLFERLDRAAKAALEVRKLEASACDLMDRRLLTLARETNVHFHLLIPEQTEAVLLVETQGDDAGDVRSHLQKILDRIRRKHLSFGVRVASDRSEFDLFWELARRVIPTLYRLTGSNRPLPFMEDAAIPPEVLPEFLVRLQNVLKKHQVTASLFAHAGHGQLHVRPFLDLADPNHVDKMRALAADFYQEVFDVRGTISGEHGDGLSRTAFVAQQFGPLYQTLLEVKRLFDPLGIFNPGKIISSQPDQMSLNLRPVSVLDIAPEEGNEQDMAQDEASDPDQPTGVRVPLQLTWNESDLLRAARTCNGCGECRTQSSDTRMCPIFRFAPSEEASPRAKANLMRALLTGRLDPSELNGDVLKSIADLCFNCHQCRLECPAGVDIPKLMIECKSQYVGTNGLRLSDSFVTRIDTLSTLGSLVSPFTNWMISNPQARWLLEKVFGLAQGRKLPRLAARTFLGQAARRRLTRPTRSSGLKVLYFVDIYANWYDVQLAEALVAVLEHNGVSVYVPPAQRHSGMAAISLGALDRARPVAAHNIQLLAEAVRQGYHIVATEPAAALCLTHEYLNLFDDDDAHLVAENTSEACTYLWRMHQTGKLRLDLKPVNAALSYHMPCHLLALGVGSPGQNLLALIPGLSVERIERGCSGMAGTFGLKRENYRTSLRAGWGLISAMREPAVKVGTTECSSCKIQMEQGTSKSTIHPLKLLALSYGLMPEAAGLLHQRSQELTIT